MLSVAWLALKRMPRIMCLVFLFITIFLLAFLLLGCTQESSVYSSTFLIRYSFNKSSSIFPLIEKSFTSKNLTGYEDMIVRTGYLGLCVDVGDDITCTGRKDFSVLNSISAVNVYTVNSNTSSTTLDLIALAADFTDDIVHPYVLIATIVLSIVQFLALFYVVIPSLPAKHIITKFNLILAPVLALLWGFGSMWTHVAADAGQSLVEKASMGIVQAHIGKKAAALTWTPFTFLLIVALTVVGLYFRDLNKIIDAVDPKV
ncbi:CYFA0S12e02476g1_1 [Cyberlindnera fabianii]|nr:CYFA0S12e02476g1_1 [Cyberlindnera fabianii]